MGHKEFPGFSDFSRTFHWIFRPLPLGHFPVPCTFGVDFSCPSSLGPPPSFKFCCLLSSFSLPSLFSSPSKIPQNRFLRPFLFFPAPERVNNADPVGVGGRLVDFQKSPPFSPFSASLSPPDSLPWPHSLALPSASLVPKGSEIKANG